MTYMALDAEVYPNYTLIATMERGSSEAKRYERRLGGKWTPNLKCLLDDMRAHDVCTYNGERYDSAIIAAAMANWAPDQVYEMSRKIIEENQIAWKVMKESGIKFPYGVSHVDLFPVSPALHISLKMCGARMHTRSIQDLPYDPTEPLTESQMDEVADYCGNDLRLTLALLDKVEGRITVRRRLASGPMKKVKQSILGKSDAQIAEIVMRRILGPAAKPTGRFPPFKIKVPILEGKGTELHALCDELRETEFKVSKTGSPIAPQSLAKRMMTIGQTDYKLGIGGLHSQESALTVQPHDGDELWSWDVASYYPNLITSMNLSPRNNGAKFLASYQKIIEMRLAAKSKKDKDLDAGLKIVLNGCFGKFGSQWSCLYDPSLMTSTTVSGQILLLRLIQRLEDEGIQILSANTDGIMALVPAGRSETALKVASSWSEHYHMPLERDILRALYARDVSNYIAVHKDGYKGKGIWAEPGLQKTPAGQVSVDAARLFMAEGVPIEETIRGCTDPRAFIHVRKVAGGGLWNEKEIGRVARWIWTTDGSNITYRKTGNKVALADHVIALPQLPDALPETVDLERYESAAIAHVDSCGFFDV